MVGSSMTGLENGKNGSVGCVIKCSRKKIKAGWQGKLMLIGSFVRVASYRAHLNFSLIDGYSKSAAGQQNDADDNHADGQNALCRYHFAEEIPGADGVD